MKMKRSLTVLLAASMLGSFCLSSVPAAAEETAAGETEAEEKGQWEVPEGVEELFRVEFPEMPPYPEEENFKTLFGGFDDKAYNEAYDKWWTERRSRQELLKGGNSGLERFFTEDAKYFLAGDEEKNHVYSPINIYLALALLAEVTEGESRQQLLDVLGAADIDELNEAVNALWNGNYSNDNAVTCLLSASMWLNDQLHFDREVIEKAAESAFASVYSGDMADEGISEALRKWLSAATGGLLDEQIREITMDPETIISLATAIYFKAAWQEEFWKDLTSEDIFHAASGEQKTEFMHQSETGQYWYGEKFGAVEKYLQQAGSILFVLPDEGVSPQELFSDADFMAFAAGDRDKAESSVVMVNLSLPKFDVSADQDLVPGLKELGITNVFDPAQAEFSLLDGEPGIQPFVSQVKHAARVKVDEEGVEAAAFTVMMTEGAMLPPDEEVNFVLDRPFIFVVRGAYGTPLFAGIVNTVE